MVNFNPATVWAKNLQKEMNIQLAFQAKLSNISDIKEDKRVIFKLCAENCYQVFAGGKFIAFGPARTALGYTRMDEFDLTDFVYDGKIIVTIIVTGNNVNSFETTNDKPFFGGSIYCGDRVVASTGDFDAYFASCRTIKTQRYSFQRHFSESYITSCNRNSFYLGERISAFEKVETELVASTTIIPRRIDYLTYENAKAGRWVGSGTIEISHTREFPTDRAIDGVDGVEILGFTKEDLDVKLTDEASRFIFNPKKIEKLTDKTYHLYDFKTNLSGMIGVDLTAKRKSTIYFIWDEVLKDDGCSIDFFRLNTCNVIKWELEAGEYNLLSFEPYTMRYGKLIIDVGEVEVSEVYLKLVENPQSYRIKFQCEDAVINNVFEAARNTFAQNASDIFMDCPSRERAGWLCDSYFTGNAEKLITGFNDIETNFLENYYLYESDEFLPRGMIPMCYPGGHPDGVYIPNWSMWYVMQLGARFKRTQDFELVEKSKEKVMELVNFFEKFENNFGLLEKLESWVFIEWSASNSFVQDVNFPSNMLYAGMLEVVSKLYDLPKLKIKAEVLKKTIYDLSFNGEFFIDNAIRENGELKRTENISETCQYYAFYFDVATPQKNGKLLKTLIDSFGENRNVEKSYPKVHKSNAFIGNFLRLDYLSRIDEHEKVINDCREYFGFMADKTGTLWEFDSVKASCNHGFQSYCINLIVKALTGFEYADLVNKKLYFSKTTFPLDCKIDIPIGNQQLKLEVVKKKMSIKKPEEFDVVKK